MLRRPKLCARQTLHRSESSGHVTIRQLLRIGNDLPEARSCPCEPKRQLRPLVFSRTRRHLGNAAELRRGAIPIPANRRKEATCSGVPKWPTRSHGRRAMGRLSCGTIDAGKAPQQGANSPRRESGGPAASTEARDRRERESRSSSAPASSMAKLSPAMTTAWPACQAVRPESSRWSYHRP